MPMQLVPLALVRNATDGQAHLIAQPLTDKLPPAQTMLLQIGPGFTSKSMLVQTLKDLITAIENAPLGMEPAA